MRTTRCQALDCVVTVTVHEDFGVCGLLDVHDLVL